MQLYSALCLSNLLLLVANNSVECFENYCLSEEQIKIEKIDQIRNGDCGISLLLDRSEENINTTFKSTCINSTNLPSVITGDSLMENNLNGDTLSNGTKSYSDERYLIDKMSSKIFQFSKPFDASRSPTASVECREHTKLYLKSLKNFELWALQMHDSSGHLSSGILNGNINQFGDFDQCMNVIGPLHGLQGQYCLAYLQLNVAFKSGYLKKVQNLIQSHGAFKSEFNDPGHRIPRFSLINWALCVPSSCSPQDVEYSFKEHIRNLTLDTEISFQVRIEPRMCQKKGDKEIDVNTKLAGSFFVVIILISFLSTIYEKNRDEGHQNDWFTTFSLRRNLKWLFNTDSNPGDIKPIHGIRFFNAVMLLLSHKSMALLFNPYINRTYLSETLGQRWTVLGRAAAVYTDPFLLFSGMLTTYSIVGRLQKGQSIKLQSEYMGRLLRIVPTLGALILFCTYIMPLLGSGPQWNLVVRHHSDLCKKFWWRNLLFIHNYFGFSNMCLTHTHHLGIDTQLFVFSPIFIIFLWKRPRKGVAVLFALIVISTGARFYTTVANRLSNYIYFGTSIQRLFKTADYMYTFPPHRATIYIIGILLGYALRMSRNLKLSNNQLRLGWLISTICFCATLIGPAPMGDMDYIYNPLHAGYYAAFAPIAWCTLFIWIVFTSHLGYENTLSRILSWKGFQVTTKLSYAIYLTQFPVFFFNVGRKRNADFYSFIPLMLDTNEYLCIFLASVVLTLLFDAPFQNIKKLLSNQCNHKAASISQDKNEYKLLKKIK